MDTGIAYTVRSMVAPLRRVLLVRPSVTGDFAGAGWRDPDRAALLREHDEFAALLESLGVDVTVEPAPDGLVDACFAYDSAYVAGTGYVRLQLAKPARRAEPEFMARWLDANGVPCLGTLTGAATADGGDMFFVDSSTLMVGRGYRTNAAAHAQLAELLAPQGISVERADLPHHRGPDHVMHLMSVVSPVAEDLAVVFEPLAPVSLLEQLDARGIRWVACEPGEWESQGCNVLAVRPGVVVVADGNPVTRARLEAAGVEVHAYHATELNKGDGGPTCLTRPLLRLG